MLISAIDLIRRATSGVGQIVSAIDLLNSSGTPNSSPNPLGPVGVPNAMSLGQQAYQSSMDRLGALDAAYGQPAPQAEPFVQRGFGGVPYTPEEIAPNAQIPPEMYQQVAAESQRRRMVSSMLDTRRGFMRPISPELETMPPDQAAEEQIRRLNEEAAFMGVPPLQSVEQAQIREAFAIRAGRPMTAQWDQMMQQDLARMNQQVPGMGQYYTQGAPPMASPSGFLPDPSGAQVASQYVAPAQEMAARYRAAFAGDDVTGRIPWQPGLDEQLGTMRQENNFAQNASSAIAQVPWSMASGIVGLADPQAGKAMQETARQAYGEYDPTSAGGILGTAAGMTMMTVPTMLAPQTAPALLSGFGASSAGQKRIEVADRRQQGQEISQAQEWTNAIVTGLAEVVGEKIGLDVFLRTSNAFRPAIVSALARGDTRAAAAIATQFAKSIGVNVGEEMVTQYIQDVADVSTGVNRQVDPIANLIQAGTAGAAMGVTGGMAAGGIGYATGRADQARRDAARAEIERQTPRASLRLDAPGREFSIMAGEQAPQRADVPGRPGFISGGRPIVPGQFQAGAVESGAVLPYADRADGGYAEDAGTTPVGENTTPVVVERPDEADDFAFNIDDLSTADLRVMGNRYGIGIGDAAPRGDVLDELRKVEAAKGSPFTEDEVWGSVPPVNPVDQADGGQAGGAGQQQGEQLGQGGAVGQGEPPAQSVPDATPAAQPAATAKPVAQMTRAELVEELAGKGLSTKGLVGVLRKRAEAARATAPEVAPAAPETAVAGAETAPEVAPAVEGPRIEQADAPAAEPPSQDSSPAVRLADRLVQQFRDGKPITKMNMLAMAKQEYGGGMAEGTFDTKDATDALELAVNKWVIEKAPSIPEKGRLGWFQGIVDNLPTQTVRSGETDALQQFSTPPHYAYVAAWVANIGPSDIVLEPSAGTGSIAAAARVFGPSQVLGNEISPRRLELLRSLGLDRVFDVNAEQLNNLLPADVRPTVVVMNPPFSQTAGRMGNKKVPLEGGKHIEQALKRLPPGGRLVAIVGRGMSFDAPTFRDWWRRIRGEYTVRANVAVSGDVYKKYGTSFDTRLLVIDKTGPTQANPVVGDASNLVELSALIKEVRDGRPEIKRTDAQVKATPGRSGEAQPAPSQQGSRAETPRSQGGTDVRAPLPDSTDAVATGGRAADSGGGGDATAGGRTAEPSADQDAGIAVPEGSQTVGGARSPSVDAEPDTGSGEPAATPERTDGDADRVDRPREPKPKQELRDDVIFDSYRPAEMPITNAKSHPSKLVQSAAMATVSSPPITAKPNLPPMLINAGKPSDAQLEAISLAIQAHEQMLEDDQGKPFRRGFFDGDGTGVGKGVIISSVMMHNWREGRRKAVWITHGPKLLPDARRDWQGVGGKPEQVIDISKTKIGEDIKSPEGILFMGYSTLQSGFNGTPGAQGKIKARLPQIVKWLGKDFDGVIAFDEAHKMKNAMPVKGERGTSAPSQVALAAAELQKALPNARVIYMSATGATEVANLGYLDRLGLWGKGTAFPTKADFLNQISRGGVAAMELVARDMKQMGLYIARSLSFDGVGYEKLEHPLTEDQRVIYNKLVEAWQVVLRDINAALELTAGEVSASGQVRIDPKAKSAAYSAFWGAHQRFFQQIMTAMQMPSVIRDIDQQVKNGNAAVVQLVNTNEASTDRALAQMKEQGEEDLENLDITPRDQLIQMVQNSFPIWQREQYQDEDGNTRWRAVEHNGKAVENPEAVAMRDKLIEEIGSISVPEGPLDMLINHFGPDQVAEVTGRTQRIVRVREGGVEKTKREPLSPAKMLADAKAFQDDRKKILVFSQAGGTGASYHAAKNAANQRLRVHYLVQAGWQAEAAVQGFGRTHRSDETQPPLYKLVSTDLNGQKRFISTIARRLDQLGALTKGQRQAGGQGMFKASDNLESQYAKDALQQLYRDLYNQRLGLGALEAFEAETGLKLRDEQGNLKQQMPPITQFLNRLLSMSIDRQNELFDAFQSRLDNIVRSAEENGTLDVGMETIRADKVQKISEKTVYTDPRSGSQTKHVQLMMHNRTRPTTFSQVKRKKIVGYAKNNVSGRVYAFEEGPNRTLEDGRVIEMHRQHGPLRSELVPKYKVTREGWTRLTEEEAKPLWDAEVKALPEFDQEEVHLITGAILPIWDRLPTDNQRVYRLQTDDGEVLLGRVIEKADVVGTLDRLGVSSDNAKLTPAEAVASVLNDRVKLTLANGWEIKSSKVASEDRIELVGPNFAHTRQLESDGVFTERIQFKTRYFIPTGAKSVETMKKVLDQHPIAGTVRLGRPIPPRRGFLDLSFIFGRGEKPSRNPFSDESVEARYADARKGVVPPGILERIKETALTTWARATRPFEYLPLGARFAEAKAALLHLQKQKPVRQLDAVNALEGITEKLRPDDYDLFTRKVILDDLMEEIEQQKDAEAVRLPFGLDADQVRFEHERMTEKIEGRESVAEAIGRRKEMWDTVKAEYIQAMADIGFNVEEKFTRENYFRHQVLEYAALRAPVGTGQRLKSPTGRGFLRQREGSDKDINANYLQAEFEVLSQMLYDQQIARTIKRLARNYDMLPELKKAAVEHNDKAVMQVFLRMTEGNPLEAVKLYKELNKKMAIAFGKLFRLAAEGQLPDSPDGRWAGLIEDMADAYHQKKADDTDSDTPTAAGLDDQGMRQLWAYASWVMDLGKEKAGEAGMAAGMLMKGKAEKKANIKELAGKDYVEWEDIVPEGYVQWQPRQGSPMFVAYSIPEKLANDLLGGVLQEAGLQADQIQRVMAKGSPFKPLVIPEELAATLDKLFELPSDNPIAKASEALQSKWKQYQLFNPRRFAKFMLRNISGDADAVFAFNPGAFAYTRQAAAEITAAFRKGEMTPTLRGWFERGGFQQLLVVQELGDVDTLPQFKNLRTAEKGLVGLPKAAWDAWWKKTATVSNWREAILRYANYLSYLEQISASPDGKPKNFGAALPDEVMALKDKKDRAFLLSNEVMGAYDQISVYGQSIRRHLIPFWSFQESNFRRYIRGYKNAARDGRLAETVGRHFVRTAVNPLTYARIGAFTMKAGAVWAMLQAFNWLLLRDEEEDLPREVRARPHIVLGRDSEGNVRYFDRLGSYGDSLEWFGLDTPTRDAGDWLSGRRTAAEISADMALNAPNKLINGLSPFFKMPATLLTGVETYPEPMQAMLGMERRRSIRDKADWLARQFSVEHEFRQLTDRPDKPYLKTWGDAMLYRRHPDEAAYWAIQDEKRAYKKKIGMDSDGEFNSPRTQALRDFKVAIRYGDKDAADAALRTYALLGGTRQGIERSMQSMAPLAGLKKADQSAFYAQLRAEDRQLLVKAERYYRQVLLGQKGQ